MSRPGVKLTLGGGNEEGFFDHFSIFSRKTKAKTHINA